MSFDVDFTSRIITASAGLGGTIYPSGEIELNYGSDTTFTFTPNSGYIIDSVLVDGVNIPTAVASGSYTFKNVTEWHTIAVRFIIDFFCGGDGTITNPYQICTAEQLANLATYVNLGNNTYGKYFILMNDIDLSKYSIGTGWKPIGTNNSSRTHFRGNFNGNGKIVKNLTINSPTEDNIGLFGYTNNANIQNLGVENCDIKGYNMVGGLIGSNYLSSISNCYATGNVNGYSGIGGLVGYNHNSTITNCYTNSRVNGGDRSIGGLVGSVTNNSIITACYANGSVTGDSEVGGLVGYSFIFTIQNCVAANDTVKPLQAKNSYKHLIVNKLIAFCMIIFCIFASCFT